MQNDFFSRSDAQRRGPLCALLPDGPPEWKRKDQGPTSTSWATRAQLRGNDHRMIYERESKKYEKIFYTLHYIFYNIKYIIQYYSICHWEKAFVMTHLDTHNLSSGCQYFWLARYLTPSLLKIQSKRLLYILGPSEPSSFPQLKRKLEWGFVVEGSCSGAGSLNLRNLCSKKSATPGDVKVDSIGWQTEIQYWDHYWDVTRSAYVFFSWLSAFCPKM